jgi:hypothetical protein
MTYIANVVLFFAEYFPEGGRKTSEHVEDLLYGCTVCVFVHLREQTL